MEMGPILTLATGAKVLIFSSLLGQAKGPTGQGWKKYFGFWDQITS